MQVKGTENIFSKFIEEKLPILKKEISIKLKKHTEYKIDSARKEIPHNT